jgi:hypothetical protein
VASNCRSGSTPILQVARIVLLGPQWAPMDDFGVDHDGGRSNASYGSHKLVPFALRENILEVLETTGFITPYIFHPIQGFLTYFPTMGAVGFNPEIGIGNLAGKVILVTGGEFSPFKY